MAAIPDRPPAQTGRAQRVCVRVMSGLPRVFAGQCPCWGRRNVTLSVTSGCHGYGVVVRPRPGLPAWSPEVPAWDLCRATGGGPLATRTAGRGRWGTGWPAACRGLLGASPGQAASEAARPAPLRVAGATVPCPPARLADAARCRPATGHAPPGQCRAGRRSSLRRPLAEVAGRELGCCVRGPFGTSLRHPAK